MPIPRIVSFVLILLFVLGTAATPALAAEPEAVSPGTDSPPSAVQAVRSQYLVRGGIGVAIVLILYVILAVLSRCRIPHSRRTKRTGRR